MSTTGEECFALCRISATNDADAQDWAAMLLGMYQNWAKRQHFEFHTIEVFSDEPVTPSSAIFTIQGHSAARLLASESGVHRLVRVSPFDPEVRRTTSFAAVKVMSLLDLPDNGDLPIRSYVLDPYRSVTDLRTDYQTLDVQSVLAGDLDAFMEAYQRRYE